MYTEWHWEDILRGRNEEINEGRKERRGRTKGLPMLTSPCLVLQDGERHSEGKDVPALAALGERGQMEVRVIRARGRMERKIKEERNEVCGTSGMEDCG